MRVEQTQATVTVPAIRKKPCQLNATQLIRVVILPRLDFGGTGGTDVDRYQQQGVPRVRRHARPTEAPHPEQIAESTWLGITGRSHIRVVDIVRTKAAH